MRLIDNNPRSAFPSDGKVLVVGMDAPITIRSRYMNRAYFYDPSQLVRRQDFPPKVAAVVLTKYLIPGDERRIVGFAEELEIKHLTRAGGIPRLEEVLNQHLRGVDLLVDPARSEVSAKAEAVSKVRPVAFPKPTAEEIDQERMPRPEEGEVQTNLGYYWIRVDRIRLFEEQPRKYFDPVSLALLASGISEEGQQEPIWVKRVIGYPDFDYELIDGERRFRACQIIHVSHMRAVFKRPKNLIQQYKQSVVGNFGQEPHPPLETARSIHKLANELPELRGLPTSRKMEALSHIYVKSVSWVSYHFSLLKLTPEVQAIMEASVPKNQRLPLAMGTYLSTVDNPALQLEIAKLVVVKGLTVNQARNYARRRAFETGQAIGGRKRQPRDDYARFNRFVKRVIAEGDVLLEITEDYFETMFKPRSQAELRSMFDRLDYSVKILTQLRDRVKKLDC